MAGPARRFRNDGGSANHWVRQALRGDGRRSSRDAIGAKVEIRLGDQICRRRLFPAKSYLSSAELPLTLGSGKEEVNQIKITWPGGQGNRTVRDLKPDRVYIIDKGGGVRS